MARRGFLGCAQALLRAGADIEARDNAGYTALMDAAAEGQVALVEALLLAGAKRGVLNEADLTALQCAAEEEVDNAHSSMRPELRVERRRRRAECARLLRDAESAAELSK